MKVLIAEDHARIAETYKLMLESENHEVLVARNGAQCIEYYDEADRLAKEGGYKAPDGTPFDIVVLDYHLPIKDGIEIARHILGLVPNQRILLASSYPVDVITRTAESLQGTVELLIKPFDLVDFVSVVSKVKIAPLLSTPLC